MILADTSVLIDLLRGEISASKIEEKGRIASCFPVECELYKGTKMARNTEEGQKHIEKLLQQLEKLEADQKAAKKFSDLKQNYPEINDFDLMIAGICFSHDAKILTQDEDFQEIEELEKVELEN